MAHKKGVGSSRNGRDSNSKHLGVKVSDGQAILAGGIILKQRGTKIHPGSNVRRGVLNLNRVHSWNYQHLFYVP